MSPVKQKILAVSLLALGVLAMSKTTFAVTAASGRSPTTKT
jgi:hypothetical protein